MKARDEHIDGGSVATVLDPASLCTMGGGVSTTHQAWIEAIIAVAVGAQEDAVSFGRLYPE
jgi:hypothetical protein